MINREITYERNIHSSYMKIPSVMEVCFDEKLLLRKKYSGCLIMEKCFVNGQGQYWYNITGKQALDAYCRVNAIGISFFETLLLRICNQLELLEWNLIDSHCLMVDPELIFVNNRGEDISFVLYPNKGADFFQDFQQLMEYLLTKLNHSDKGSVHTAYKIYQMTLSDSYSMSDIKDAVLTGMQKETLQKAEKDISKRTSVQIPTDEIEQVSTETKKKKEIIEKRENVKNSKIPYMDVLQEKWKEFQEKVKNILSVKPKDFLEGKMQFGEKEEFPTVIYPEENEEMERIEIHPTICLTASFGEPRGVLLYEGLENYVDFELEQMICLIGKNDRARMRIEKDTISQFHAKIDYMEDNYYIEDLNSTNGTYVNDEILNYKERKILQVGDIIRFADVKYRFV